MNDAEVFDALRWGLSDVIEFLAEALGFQVWNPHKATPFTQVRDFIKSQTGDARDVEAHCSMLMGSPSMRVVLGHPDKLICGCYAAVLAQLLRERGALVEVCTNHLLYVWATQALLDNYAVVAEELYREAMTACCEGQPSIGDTVNRNFKY